MGAVEMVHGRLHRLEVGNDGRIRLGEKDEDYAWKTIGGVRWEQLLLFGQCWGWQPMGTVLDYEFEFNHSIRSDYEPSSWGPEPYKLFLAADAL